MSIIKPKFKVAGGIHPSYNKQLSAGKPITVMPLPSLLRVSMAQHLGAPAKPIVKKGDAVLRGQVIGEPAGFISASVHAPTSGTVKAVAEAPTASGRPAIAVDIEPDGNDTWTPEIEQKTGERKQLLENFNKIPEAHKEEMLQIVASAGIAGMGGAGFPTHVKLNPPKEKPIDTLIINGAECEPYLTADHRLMVERAEEIWAGAQIIKKILGASKIRIAIEDNKPDAIKAISDAMKNSGEDAAVVALTTEYPQGAEKQQIFAVSGRQVPSGGLPMDVSAVVENVGTTLAVWDAVVNGRPLTERVTTVTGYPVREPGNVMARIGTLYSDMIQFCGGTTEEPGKVISGGPMMGIAQHNLEASTTKTTSGLLLLSKKEVIGYESTPCISCGRCVQGCPMNLMPCELSQMLEAEDYDAAEKYCVLDCIECGCCAFQCPAHRPLVQHMRQGKAYVMQKRRNAKK